MTFFIVYSLVRTWTRFLTTVSSIFDWAGGSIYARFFRRYFDMKKKRNQRSCVKLNGVYSRVCVCIYALVMLHEWKRNICFKRKTFTTRKYWLKILYIAAASSSSSTIQCVYTQYKLFLLLLLMANNFTNVYVVTIATNVQNSLLSLSHTFTIKMYQS